MPPVAVQPSRAGTTAWPAAAVARYIERGYWENRPLSEHIATAADAAPDAVALIDGEMRLTYRELMARADGAALALGELGLCPDDRIIVQLPNSWEFVVFTLACLRLGAIPVMALPPHRVQEISSIATVAQARAIAVPDEVRGFDHQAMAWDVAGVTPTVSHVLVAGTEVRGRSCDLRSLCAPASDPAAARARLDAAAPAAGDVAMFLLSGGTTGLPKLIARTHNDYAYMAKRAAQICGCGPDSVYLAVLPLGHGFPMAGPGVLGTLMSGGRVVIAASPAPERAFPAIERERVSMTSLVPAAVQRWLEHRAGDPDTDLTSLRLLQVGGSRLADHVASQITPALGADLQQVYGMAEGLLCLTRPGDSADVVCHTQGRPICPDDELLIVDEHGAPVPAGAAGVLLTRGPYTPRGYYRDDLMNARAFVGDGWYRTGDIVRQRADGNLVVEGRDKDVINRGGEKISAEEVENYAYQVDAVRLAAAVAMPDQQLGERICLYVVVQSGSTVELADVRAVMSRAGVAHFKLPEHLVVVDSLPTTNVGKVDKKSLRADIARRLSRRS